MKSREVFRVFIVVALCVVLAVPAFSQSGGFGNIGPSKGEVIGIIAGAAAAIGVAGYLIYRAAHKHASIQGCISSDQDGLVLRNERDKKAYALVGDIGAFKSGQRLALSGKKMKGSSGNPAFQVQKLTKDFGACKP
jgi:hypothetical protein